VDELSTLDSLASSVLTKAEKGGVSQAEAFILDSHIRSIYIEDGTPRLADDKLERGLGLKACMRKRIGFSSGVISNIKSAEEIVNEVLSIAKTTKEDPDFQSLPSGEVSGEVKDVFCEETAEITTEEIVARTMTAVRVAEKNEGVKVPLGLLRLAKYSLQVSNSLGVRFNHKGTMVFLHFTAKATRGETVGEGVEKVWSTKISSIDFERIGNSIAEKALRTLEADAFRGELKGIAVIDPVETAGLLNSVKFATSSEQVNKGRSPWSKKIGTKVASKEFTVMDDGTYPGGIKSAAADDEGVKTTKKPIISNGVLRSYIYDSYNANIAGVKATGNGFRRGTRSIEGAFAAPVNCAYSNMTIKLGNKSREEIISQIDEGVLVERFASPEVNPITGGFGCEVRNATLIEGGQLTRHVKHALLIGNMYDYLRNVVGVGNDVKIVGDIILPTIAFSDATLIGQK
jgi:PmbA protein